MGCSSETSQGSDPEKLDLRTMSHDLSILLGIVFSPKLKTTTTHRRMNEHLFHTARQHYAHLFGFAIWWMNTDGAGRLQIPHLHDERFLDASISRLAQVCIQFLGITKNDPLYVPFSIHWSSASTGARTHRLRAGCIATCLRFEEHGLR